MSVIPVRVLGGVRLEGPGGALSVGGRQAERLLGALVAAGDRGQSLDQLAEATWPEGAPDGFVSSLRMGISRLRRRLAEAGVHDGITVEQGRYRLAVPADQVDAERFRSLVQQARALVRTEPDRAAAHYDGALALWRGDPFGRLAGEPWAYVAAAAWDELRLDAEEEGADLELARSREAEVIGRLRLAVEQEPLRERRWAQLAVALYRLGRQADALRAVSRARTLLRDELGAEPGADLERVEQGLLAHDPSLLSIGTEAPFAAMPPMLVERDIEVDEVLQLLAANRVVTLTGLGGVGKSAIARHVVRRLGEGGRHILTAALDGLTDPAQVCLAVAEALGLPGAGTPADLAAAAAGRGRGVPSLLLVDGAEGARPTVAELLDALAVTAPDLQVLVTSRRPIGASDEIRVPIEPLAVDAPDGEVPPALQLFLLRTGVTYERLPDEQRAALHVVCERTAGLPLAIELAAARADSEPLEQLAMEGGAPEQQVVATATSWMVDMMPPPSRALLEVAALLPDGLAADRFPPMGGIDAATARAWLAPLLQTRLLRTCGLAAGVVRYRSLEPVREAIEASLPPEQLAGRTATVMERLTAIGDAAGGLEHQARYTGLPAVEAALGNVRHWLDRSMGSEAGLELAVAMASPMAELGIGAEGGRWLEAHLAAAPEVAPRLRARAELASITVHGFFAGVIRDVDRLHAAAALAEAEGDQRLTLTLQGRTALALAWRGDPQAGMAMMDSAGVAEALAEIGDPWMDAQRERLRAMLLAFLGDVPDALARMRAVTQRFHELDDASSVLSTLYLRSYIARLMGDDDVAAAELRLAREMRVVDAARATQALVEVELAQHARRAGDPSAIAVMTAAVGALERAGNLRAAAVARRDLGLWRIADGDAAGSEELRAALPTLLRHDRQGAVPALAGLAADVAAGDPTGAARLAGAARQLLRTAGGTPAATPEMEGIRSTVRRLIAADPDAAAEGAELPDGELLAIALGRIARSGS